MPGLKRKNLHRALACVVVLASTSGFAFAQTADQSSMTSSSPSKSGKKGAHLKKVDNIQRDGGASGGITNPSNPDRGNPNAADPSGVR
jgi:hypothetical protein